MILATSEGLVAASLAQPPAGSTASGDPARHRRHRRQPALWRYEAVWHWGQVALLCWLSLPLRRVCPCYSGVRVPCTRAKRPIYGPLCANRWRGPVCLLCQCTTPSALWPMPSPAVPSSASPLCSPMDCCEVSRRASSPVSLPMLDLLAPRTPTPLHSPYFLPDSSVTPRSPRWRPGGLWR